MSVHLWIVVATTMPSYLPVMLLVRHVLEMRWHIHLLLFHHLLLVYVIVLFNSLIAVVVFVLFGRLIIIHVLIICLHLLLMHMLIHHLTMPTIVPVRKSMSVHLLLLLVLHIRMLVDYVIISLFRVVNLWLFHLVGYVFIWYTKF